MATPGLFKIGANALAGHMKKMSPVMSAFGASLDPYAANPEQKVATFGGDYDPYAAVATTKLNQFVTGAEAPPPLGGPGVTGTTPPVTANTVSLGGEWGNIDRWNSQIAQAQQRVQSELGVLVPMSVIKSIMRIESNGEMLAPNQDGAVGLMQLTPGAYGNYDYGRLQSDPAYNIWAGVNDLALRYLNSPGKDWGQAAVGYFSGHYIPVGSRDYGGQGNSDYWYLDQFNKFNQQLSMANSGVGGIGYNPGTSTSNVIQSMFGTGTVPDWGEFGVESSNGFYDYGRQYGMNGTQHTGVDVPMNVGSAYYAPMGGTVMCAGTGRGQGADGGGCAAFKDTFGNGAGRVEVLLDNGAVLIYGHSSTSALQPGARFNAGQMLGTSGGDVSAHVHLEARVRDASMPSGWRIVDPRTVLGDSWVSGTLPGTSGETPFQRMQRILRGSGW